MPRTHRVLQRGDIAATDTESVYIGFETTHPNERESVAGELAESIDLQRTPEHATLGTAYRLDDGTLAVELADGIVDAYGYRDTTDQ